MNRTLRIPTVMTALAAALFLLAAPLSADRVRSSSHTSVHTSTHGHHTSVNVNKSVDVHHGHGCCYHDPHPVAAVTTAAVTAAVVGSIVSSLPPNCTTVIVNGLTYQQCGSTWYQPQPGSTTYIVVNDPH